MFKRKYGKKIIEFKIILKFLNIKKKNIYISIIIITIYIFRKLKSYYLKKK